MRKEPFLYLCAFLMDGCFALIGLCIPLLALRMGASYDELGGISAIGALAYSLSCLMSGRLSDRIGYRRVMGAATLTVALIFTAYLFITRIWHLALLAAITGMTISNYWPPLQAWLGRGKTRTDLRRALGRFNVAWSLGFMLGPALGGNLFEINPHIAFALCALLVGALCFALLFLRIREGDPQAESCADTTASRPLARRFLPIAWLANFATFFAIGTVRSLFPKLATDLGVNPGLLGYLMALIALAQLTAFYLMAQTERWQFKLGPMLAAQVLAIAGLGILAASSHPLFFAAGLLMLGTLAGVTFTASIFYSLHTEGPGGRRTGIHEAIVGSGFLMGPLLGGFVAEHLGPRAPYWLAGAVILTAITVQLAMLSKKPAQGFVPQAGD